MTTHTNSPSLGVESTQTEGSSMTSRTYQPTGTGLCGECGRDVGRHDGGHEWRGVDDGYGNGWSSCCHRVRRDPIHDVGHELRCPKEAAHD